MDEPVTRWNVGDLFQDALSAAAASEAAIKAATEPMKKALDDVFSEFCSDIMDRMPGAINDEVRYRVDKIIEALLHGDADLLGSFMAAGGHRSPDIRWDGTLRSGYWVDVRRKITEANEAILRDERIADLTAERDKLISELGKARHALGAARAELSETKESLHWANVRLNAQADTLSIPGGGE